MLIFFWLVNMDIFSSKNYKDKKCVCQSAKLQLFVEGCCKCEYCDCLGGENKVPHYFVCFAQNIIYGKAYQPASASRHCVFFSTRWLYKLTNYTPSNFKKLLGNSPESSERKIGNELERKPRFDLFRHVLQFHSNC